MTNTQIAIPIVKSGSRYFTKLRIAHKTTPLHAEDSMQRSGLITHYQCGCLLVPVYENIQFRAYFLVAEFNSHLGSGIDILFLIQTE